MKLKTIFIVLALVLLSRCGNGPVETPMPSLTEEEMAHPTIHPEDLGMVYNDSTALWEYPEE